MTSTLCSRNVVVAGHRTSVRLEPEVWDALADICRREEVLLNELCTRIDRRRRAQIARALAKKTRRAKVPRGGKAGGGKPGAGRRSEPVGQPSLTSAIGVYALLYYRRRAKARA